MAISPWRSGATPRADDRDIVPRRFYRDRAESDFDVFLTADQNLRYQQNLSNRKIAIIEIPTNTLSLVKMLVPEILKELTTTSLVITSK